MFAGFTGILEGFRNRPERVRHVLCLFDVFGNQTVHSGSVWAFRKMFLKNNIGAITLTRMLPFYFRLRKWCNCSKLPKCTSEKVFSNICFPFSFRMLSVRFLNRPNTSRILISKGFFSERFPYVFRMLSEHGEMN